MIGLGIANMAFQNVIYYVTCSKRGENDEQQEEQGDDVFSVKRNSNRKKTCASKKKITVETSKDANKEGNNTNRKKRKLKQAELVKNEMVEGDKVESESNEEPPLRKNDKRKKDNVEAKKETVKKKVVSIERQVSVQKGKQKINEGSLEYFKEGKKDKDETILMVVENGKEVVLNEKVKCDHVNILTRMSPSHLKNVLDSLTTKQVSVLEELGLGKYHNNFNFTSTPRALGMWIVKNYDYDEHTIKMVDCRKIKDMKDYLSDNLSKIKALLLDTDDKIKITLDENPEDSDLKMILKKRLAFFKELNHCVDDNAMVVLDNGNDVPEESVKDNKVSKEKDDVTEKEKYVENMFEIGGKNTVQVVDQDVDKHKDVEKESEFGNNKLVNDKLVSVNTECENDNDQGKKEVEKIMKISSKELNINQKHQPEAQDTQHGMEIVAKIQEENLERVKNCGTLEEAEFPSIGIENIESLKVRGRNLFDENSTVQNENEDDMIKKAIEGEKNVPKTCAKKADAAEQDIKKPQVGKQTATRLAKSKETEAKIVKPAPTKRKKKGPNDKEETAIHASPISFIPSPIDTKKGFGIKGGYFLSLYPENEVSSTIIDLWTLVLNNEEQHRDKLSGNGNVYYHTVMMTQHSFEMGKYLEARRESFDKNIDIVLKQSKRKNFDDVNLMNSFIDYMEKKKYQKCHGLILAKRKVVQIPWKTTYNSHDCGVFVMRYMEMYLGKGNFFTRIEKEGPGQKVQLNMLCAKMPPKRTSTSEAPAMTQAAIRQLVVDSVATALETQTATMANADNANRNPKPREALVARKCSYKEFMSCQPFNFKGSEGVIRLIHWFERIESVFSHSNCTKDYKVKFATEELSTTTTTVTPIPTTTIITINHNKTEGKKLSKPMLPHQLKII
nr:ulp1 protease family, C-terminal catalytic domain-containing protein [Tanacetum cinerariifolium]